MAGKSSPVTEAQQVFPGEDPLLGLGAQKTFVPGFLSYLSFKASLKTAREV